MTIDTMTESEKLEPGDLDWLRSHLGLWRNQWPQRPSFTETSAAKVEHQNRIDRILSALAARSAPVSGYVLVPKEPTDHQVDEAVSAWHSATPELLDDQCRRTYRAMLDAAPPLPQDSGLAAADHYADRGVGSSQPFERYPKLARWIEKLANTRLSDFSHASWCAFLGEINGVISTLESEREQFKHALPDCETCGGRGWVEEDAKTTGANQHSACRFRCDACDGLGVKL